MGKSQGHAYLAGNFCVLIQEKLRNFTLTSGWERVPEELAVRVRRVRPFFTASVQVKGKLWYQPGGSFGLLQPPRAKTTAVFEVS